MIQISLLKKKRRSSVVCDFEWSSCTSLCIANTPQAFILCGRKNTYTKSTSVNVDVIMTVTLLNNFDILKSKQLKFWLTLNTSCLFLVSDIILPGTSTLTTSNPLIRAGEQVTFIKTQKGVYLRTTDGRILAVRGAQQPKPPTSSSTSSGGLPLGQEIPPTLSTSAFPSDNQSGNGGAAASSSAGQQRHQLADLLREKVPGQSNMLDPINLSSDSDADSDFFDPFKSPQKTPKKPGVGQDPGRPNSVGYPKPATCTVSPGVQSVPLPSTLPLGPFGNQSSRQTSTPSSQTNTSPSRVNNPTSSSSTTTSEPSNTATNISNLNEDSQSSTALSNIMSDLHFPHGSTNVSRSSTPTSTTSVTAPSSSSVTTTSATTSNPPATSNSNNVNTTSSMQHPMPTASTYGMPYFPGMVPMPSSGNSQQQQQPPIVINYQLPPMPPGAMMQPGFMPFGFPPMMYPPGASGQMQNQGGQYPGGMFPGMPGQGQMPMGQGQYPMGQGGQNQGQSRQGESSQSDQPGSTNSESANQKKMETEQGTQSDSNTTNA